MDARGFPQSLPEFQKAFPDDSACAKYLEHLRWPNGFTCPKCGVVDEPYRFPERSSTVLRCRFCKANISLTAGTSMQGSHTPLSIWFWGAYLITTQTPGMSALQFQRQLGLKRYETAFQMLHKLRSGMVRPDRDLIGGEYPVEVDETLVGGRTRGEGRGVHHKATVVGAVEVRTKKEGEGSKANANHSKGTPVKRQIYAGRLRLRIIENRTAEVLQGFIRENISEGSTVRTDGLKSYGNLQGFLHMPMVMGGDSSKQDEHLPLIHLIFSNVKAWLLGIHHGVSQQHLQAYLNEFTFRFNRRFYPMTAFYSVLGLASRTVPPTYEGLYSGDWIHPAA